MELIDEICRKIEPYVTDMQAVSNALYVVFSEYEVEKKTTDIALYVGDSNDLLLKKFLVAKRIKGCTKRTLEFYMTEIRKFMEDLGKNAAEVTADDVRFRIAKRMQVVSVVTCNNEFRCLQSFFSWLNAEGHIPKNPLANINQIKRRKTQKEAFTDAEIVRMRDSLETTRDKAIFEILLSTGCRVSELAQVKRSEIDGDSLMVHGKGNKDRTVYLNATAQFAVCKYEKERKDASEWLFPKKSEKADFRSHGFRSKDWWKNPELLDISNHIDVGTIEFRIRMLGRKLGIVAYPHKFRRTCATNALRAGMPIEMVSRMLGHENIGTTQIYLDLKEEDLKAMHQKYVR